LVGFGGWAQGCCERLSVSVFVPMGVIKPKFTGASSLAWVPGAGHKKYTYWRRFFRRILGWCRAVLGEPQGC